MRRAALLVALLLLAAACGGTPRGDKTPTASPTPSPSSSGPGSATPSPTPSGSPTPADCDGVGYDEVLGPRPGYGPRTLRRYAADRAVCAAYWVPQSDNLFVAQSLAVTPDGGTAYVGGYRWAPTYPPRPCQIAVVDLATGAQRAFQPKFQASIYHPAPTYCRHGGGMQLVTSGDAAGLWVQETERLWLLDPAKLGQGPDAPVLRWWRMGKGLRGSAMVIQSDPAGDRLGVAGFNPRRPGKIRWFALADLLRPGVTDLVLRDPGTHELAPVARGRVPRLLQGLAVGPGGLWATTSGSGCASLVHPDGTRTGTVPGAEGLQFVGDRLHVTSESSARPYQRGSSKLMTPPLVSLDAARATSVPLRCRP